MNDSVAVARSDDRQLIGTSGQAREKIGDFHAALAVFRKGAAGAQQFRTLLDELVFGVTEFFGARLAFQSVQQGFGVESFQVAGAACHEQEDDRLGLGGVVGGAWAERISDRGVSRLLIENGCECHRSKSTESVAHKFAS